MRKRGWFSDKQRKLFGALTTDSKEGCFTYEKAGGGEVLVTEIRDLDLPANFDDAIDKGEVGAFLRMGP